VTKRSGSRPCSACRVDCTGPVEAGVPGLVVEAWVRGVAGPACDWELCLTTLSLLCFAFLALFCSSDWPWVWALGSVTGADGGCGDGGVDWETAGVTGGSKGRSGDIRLFLLGDMSIVVLLGYITSQHG
jgi:hypothetical protein